MGLEAELNEEIVVPQDEDPTAAASDRAKQATPIAQPNQQVPTGVQKVIQDVVDKAERGEQLNPKEQQVFDAFQRRKAQQVNPQ